MQPPPYLVGRQGLFAAGLPAPPMELPLDWTQDPHGSRSWRFELHTLQWLPFDDLPAACAVALDWIVANPQHAEASDVVWGDMATARRGPRLAHLAATGGEARILSRKDAARLRAATVEHAEWLADDANYTPNNHGAYMDEALLLLAAALADHADAEAWKRIARDRLRATLRASIDHDAGLHLEHSPAYQYVMIFLLSRVVTLAPEHQDLLARMQATLPWLVTPERRFAQIGDSHATRVSRHVAVPSGVRRMPGFAAVREGGSYLLVACGHHSPVHKHADDGSFVWFEDGRQLICDTGCYSYDAEDPLRQRALSAHAHNTLTVDGNDFSFRRRRTYGDGIIDVRSEAGATVIVVSHPHLIDVTHTRTFHYRQGHLTITDVLRAREPRTFTRYLHVPEGAAVEISDESTATVEYRTTAGWTSPAFRERRATTVHELTAHGQELTLAVALHAAGTPLPS